MSRVKKVLLTLVVGAVVVAVGIQFVPVRDVGSNPPARFKMDSPPEVEAIFRRACFDCHSNETRWPFYSKLAPLDWVVARDVHNGRNHLNFSEWGDVDEDERQTDLENCWEQIESGEMPPWFYILPMHPDAKLTPADKALLKAYIFKNAKKDDKKDKPSGTEKAGDGDKNVADKNEPKKE
jgi:hypothetical protein